MHDAPLGQIVRDGVMVGDAVIPERDVIDAPMPAQREFGTRRMRKQKGQQGIALARTHLVDTGGESLVYEQGFAAGDRMRGRPRMTTCWMLRPSTRRAPLCF